MQKKKSKSACMPTEAERDKTYFGLFFVNQVLHGFHLNVDLFKRMFGVEELVVNFIRSQKT